MKRILMYSVMAVLVLSMFMLPNQVLVSNAETVVTQQEAVDWIVAAENNYWDWDKSYGAQCVDLIYYYYNYLGVSPMGGNANHYIYDNLSGCKVPAGWERIQYYPGFIAQPGDIALWDYGEYGHIGLIVNADPYGITTLENNRYDGYGTSNALSGWRAYDSLNFWGVIRPAFPKTTLVISYDVNGGSWQGLGNYVTQSKLRDNPVTLLQSHPTRPGFDFIGWSTNPYATQAQYQPGDVYTENWNLSLYAVWQIDPANAFTISYNANGGSGAPRDQIKGRGYDLTLSNERPVREGYTFAGWSTDPYATSATYSAGGKFTIDANTTLYAVWDIAGLYSEIENGEVTITGYSGTLSVFNIPETINGYPVTTIGNSAFQYCDNLTSVTIGNSVTTIGYSAFRDCDSLTGITIPDSVTTIGYYAFSGCSSLTGIWVDAKNPQYASDAYGVLFNKAKTELIQAPGGISGSYFIPDSVTTIGSYAFSDCDSLTSVTIGDSVTTIGNYAFQSCDSLTSVTIGDSVTTIGKYAFYYCDSLTSVTMGDSVTTIGNSAFQYCRSLTSVTIGDSVTTIGDSAFYDCSSLTSVTIGDSVTTIGEAAFRDCDSLTSITIGDSVTTIGNFAFSFCDSLTGVTIGDSVTCIGEWAFFDCNSLTIVTIPDSVTTIGVGAFANCDSLTGIWVDAKNPQYASNAYGVLFNKAKTKLIQAPGGISGSYFIPDSVTTIGDSAFSNCNSLTSVTIGDSVTTIDAYAFFDCNSLTIVTIPDSVTTIGESAFAYCSRLTSVTIGNSGNSITSIGFAAFAYCSNLSSVTIGDSVIGVADCAFEGCTDLISVTIGDGVTSIGWFAFGECSSLTSISIGESVTSIDESAFNSCSSLETVYYAGTEEQWQAIDVIWYGNEALQNANIIFNYKPDFGKVDTWNLILKEDIGVNFEMEFTDTILADPNAYVEIHVAGKITKIPVSTAVNGLQINIAPAQMTDEIKICIVSSSGTRDEVSTYSVRGYADAILSGGYSNQTKNMVRYVLTYGAMAQKYFGYNESTLANEGINCTLEDVPDLEEAVVGISGELEGVTFYGASLVYRDRIAVRYYFTGDITGLIFTANGSTYRPVAKDGMHYVEIANILPQDLDNQITLTAIDPQGGTISVTYGPMNYIVRMNAAGNGDLKNLLKALYNYHLAAKAMV